MSVFKRKTIKHRRNKKRKRPFKRLPVKPELLAPAGNHDSFYAAMENGADAVYCSPAILNARAYGKNFSIGEIGQLTETAHSRGRKIFIALNSLMKEAEIPQAVRLLAAMEEMGVDALIIQDLGVWRICRKYFPGLRLHASTIMTIHNSAGVQAAERMGFSRVVLARELTLKEIASITRTCQAELEVFIHGAMCFTMSGMCLFSSYFGGRSSTRGRCVQPCRRRYTWKGRPGTFFSMDDLCGLETVPELARLGITSLKIEGRLKPADYVAAVTRAYRMIIDADLNSYQHVLEKAQQILQKAMGRPASTGYFLSENPRSAISPTRTANTGQYMGRISRGQNGWLHLAGPGSIDPGDMLRVVKAEKDLQFSSRCLEVKRRRKQSSFKLERIPLEAGRRLSGALVFKTSSAEKVDNKSQRRPAGDSMGQKWKMPARAQKKADEITKKVSGGRKAGRRNKKKTGRPEIYLKLSSADDLRILGKLDVKAVILELSPKNIRSIARRLPKSLSTEKIIWSLSPVLFQKGLGETAKQVDMLMRQGFRNFQVSNLSHLTLFWQNRQGRKTCIYGSYEMNILNSQAIKAAKSLGVSICHFSIETDISNMHEALSACGERALFTVFGFIPLFTSRLRHRIYDSKVPVTSTRGEKYLWKGCGDTGRLFAKAPFSALDLQEELLEAGAEKWILDFSRLPGNSRIPPRLPPNLKTLSSKFRGRSFNLKGKLQ